MSIRKLPVSPSKPSMKAICTIISAGIVFAFGCSSNKEFLNGVHTEDVETPNRFYENFIEVYLRGHEDTSREEAEAIIHETFLEQRGQSRNLVIKL